MITSKQLNYLIWRYLQESGFLHSSYSFQHETDVSSLDALYASLHPGALVDLVQKGIQYAEVEHLLNADGSEKADPEPFTLFPTSVTYKIDDLKLPYTAREIVHADGVTAVSEKDGLHVGDAFMPHTEQILCVVLSGVLALTGQFDGTVRVWKQTGELVALLTMDRKPVLNVALVGTKVAAVDCIGGLAVWDIETSEAALLAPGAEHAALFDLVVLGADAFARSIGDDIEIYAVAPDGVKLQTRLAQAKGHINALLAIPQGLIACTDSGVLVLWTHDAAAGTWDSVDVAIENGLVSLRYVRTNVAGAAAAAAAASPAAPAAPANSTLEEGMVATADTNGVVYVFSVPDLHPQGRVSYKYPIFAYDFITLSNKQHRLIGGSKDGVLFTWAVPSMSENTPRDADADEDEVGRDIVRTNLGGITCVTGCADGQALVVGSRGGYRIRC
ncbi:WD40-repeat-containing domain protein [Dipodascopsis tothii]|uniref:WD40-repeat-containing domain protein n=1 Tax=Dipodascopsis tothii TaxID=44089 RepID=UPI0034D0150E